jgi:pSer/pThr/pTyr-binding forkhead associated (FHA) protein
MRMVVHMAKLCLLDENGVTTEAWEIGDDPLAVGRGVGANVVVDDATLSRVHFMIAREDGKFVLTDMSSQNGTWVDGERAMAKTLRHHDCILAGKTLFIFSEPESRTSV